LAWILVPLTTLHAASDAGLPSSRQYWGAETNGVKAGLCFQLAPNATNQVQVLFLPALSNSQTNNGNLAPDRLHLWLPPFDSRYRMELTDQAGKPVRKTNKGAALGRAYVYSPPKTVTTRDPTDRAMLLTLDKPELVWQIVNKGGQTSLFWLSLQDYFQIRNPGKYRIEFQMTVMFWQKDTPWDIKVVCLPPVEADLDLLLPPKPPSRLLPIAKDYGVAILGLALCLAGVAWLLYRWFNPQASAPEPPSPGAHN
jgi:hypothetical protein